MKITHKYRNGYQVLILMKYRSRTDITGLILEAANGGATKDEKSCIKRSYHSAVERILGHANTERINII